MIRYKNSHGIEREIYEVFIVLDYGVEEFDYTRYCLSGMSFDENECRLSIETLEIYNDQQAAIDACEKLVQLIADASDAIDKVVKPVSFAELFIDK